MGFKNAHFPWSRDGNFLNAQKGDWKANENPNGTRKSKNSNVIHFSFFAHFLPKNETDSKSKEILVPVLKWAFQSSASQDNKQKRRYTKFQMSCVQSGAIIEDGDRKRAPFLVLGLSLWYGKIFYYLKKLRHRVRHTRVRGARNLADVAHGKWRPKFPKFFWLLANNVYVCWSF